MERVISKMQENMARLAQETVERENPVIRVFKGLGENIIDFERELDDEHEIGARLVSFGNAITFHIQNVSYSLPSLIVFSGVTETGERVNLIQHISQLSVLLIAMKKIESKPNRIGFIWSGNN